MVAEIFMFKVSSKLKMLIEYESCMLRNFLDKKSKVAEEFSKLYTIFYNTAVRESFRY